MLAVYMRCSSDTQTTNSQKHELETWLKSRAERIEWYSDSFTGLSMDRPGMNRLLSDIRAGKVKTLVVYRLDRLGRTAKGLTALFEELTERKVNLISLRDGVDLSTPAGRLIANVMASVASYETEIRSERQRAGIEAVRKANNGKCTWGGRKTGTRIKVSEEKEKAIKRMAEEGIKKSEIARLFGLSRPTVYKVLN